MDGTNLDYVPAGVDMNNWKLPENLRWSFQHMADFLPTAAISRGEGPVAQLSAALRDLDSVMVAPAIPGGAPVSVGAIMNTTETDGWMLMHRGTVLTEQYFGEMGAQTPHLLMSMSKSLIGAVAGALCDSGVLHVDAQLTDYLPELADAGYAGYAGATVRQLLDMRSGIEFSENYLDPSAGVRMMEQAIGWSALRAPGPTGMYPYLRTLVRKTAHGGVFEYRSCETDMLGWVCEAAAKSPMAALMSELVWSKLGAEFDATMGIDQFGTGIFDGGINATMRDMARFGSLFLNDGLSPSGEQVLSKEWIAQTFAGAPDSRDAFADSPVDNLMPGGMYRNQMWFPYPGDDVVLCLGIHGQMVYINRPAEVVAVKLSSWPIPQDPARLFPTLHAFDAIAAALLVEVNSASPTPVAPAAAS
ncbi:serine hydrolase domain-containing protein [Paeniglutamicibacter gangotriensis]|uniref:Putative 6-aminohexanoate-dimer hydrolase n=1 Tax=Paeniglutamicibacter gangotriensis Lz1y TaxID=1276920 RepID=M7NKQ6_9MICC|nr:serine hydrolase [Paeniglutamicibacter gangotriensis]EMQ99138.1 putative 6-aminohexanoate-dimer hydrolase [Paeniglutamicibacter gangotriensis Lz1y]